MKERLKNQNPRKEQWDDGDTVDIEWKRREKNSWKRERRRKEKEQTRYEYHGDENDEGHW